MRLALYRKYRSADFDEVLGQDHVSSTLRSAIKRGLISHAYLFTGPRGVGKTSVARILARAVNELPPETDISQYLDIIEIDAASNRGIDEIRTLRERIASAPSQLKYKVYIIDEVHMLTREAFNALLKTLEEPPAHAIFVLATTESHKLPDTIISRTQRFDFRPISSGDIVKHLADIAQKEKIDIDEGALVLLAGHSHGGFRDAISLLDQISALDKKITEQIVADFLGLSATDQVESLLGAVIAGQSAEAVTVLESMLSRGIDPVNITNQLLDEVRQRLILGVKDVKKSDAANLILLADSLTQALSDFKVSEHYSLPLELAVYKAAVGYAPHTTSTSQVKTTGSQVASAVPAPKKQSAPSIVNTDEASLTTKALSLIKDKNNSLYAVMRSAEPRVEADKFILNCRFSFHKERIEEAKNRMMIEQIMTKVFGREIELDCQLAQSSQSAEKSSDPDGELVSSALEILGGEVVNG